MPPHPPEGNFDQGSISASPDMVIFCFDTLIAKLNRTKASPPPTIPNQKFPLFVTWKKGPERHLRGCIGTFSNLSLPNGLKEYALTSAFDDSRFQPIGIHEVEELYCAVSLLVQFEDAQDYLDWHIGIHGIRIHFNDNGRERSAVFLPEVAIELGWSHTETLDNLIRKGGFRGMIDETFRRAVRVTRFQSSKTGLTYQEYLELRRR